MNKELEKVSKEELKKILENHRHWINQDCDRWETMRANLSCANLRGAYLSGAYLIGADLSIADLSGADLSGADLSRANLRGANLSGAYLSGADLREANLSGAYLREAYLSGAYLRGAGLRGADLRGADLSGADLREAYLSGAYLIGAYLRGADLSGADLRGADLSGADLSDAKNIPFIPMACPEVGSFIAYKKASGKIVELEVQSDSRRCSATTRKCRCDKAKVLRILNCDRTVSDVSEVKSNYDEHFIYRVGEIVSVDNFDDDRWNECSTGIHFFMSLQEAVDY